MLLFRQITEQRKKPNPAIPMIRQGAHAQTDHERMEDFRMRYEDHCGIQPVRIWAVGFCRTCKKPAWFVGVPHINGVHCPGH